MQFFDKTNIDFLGKRKVFAIFSAVFLAVGIIVTVVAGVDYGIDFVGGTEVAVALDPSTDISQVRDAVSTLDLDPEVKTYGEAGQFLIRVKEAENVRELVEEKLNTTFGAEGVSVIKVDKIGPRIGKELRENAIYAVIFAVLAILLYIAFRFEFVFGLGAIVALVHDVVATFVTLVIFHHLGIVDLAIDNIILAGMLTVVGYSINDTVIIFDRIRENKDVHKQLPLTPLANRSINETLSRTVNTVLTTLLVLVTIMIFGGPILRPFAFTMSVGLIFGTYSSIYIASSFVLWYNKKVRKIDMEKGYGRQVEPTATLA
ncbi:MAG: protein translocase subunit SecF [Candidatus Kapaibacteriales bacterium]